MISPVKPFLEEILDKLVGFLHGHRTVQAYYFFLSWFGELDFSGNLFI